MFEKVSMVMPCFNKANYIGDMLDSVIRQNWDNIELILVNDGSTDATRAVIDSYVPKIEARGYSLNIIDQDNNGVCHAARVGLQQVTGQYVCIVDADDELSPVYVSVMAGWLSGNPGIDYCVCDGIDYIGRGKNKVFKPDWTRGKHDVNTYLIERYMLSYFRTTPWIYMLRTTYLHTCNIIPNYTIDSRGSHEPSYIIPILAYGGNFQYFPLPLYLFNVNGESHSRSADYYRMEHYHKEYHKLCVLAIDNLSPHVVTEHKKEQLKLISKISSLIRIYRTAVSTYSGEENIVRTFSHLLEYINDSFQLKNPITIQQTKDAEEVLIKMINLILLNNAPIKPKKRIIAFPASSDIAKQYLPVLEKTNLKPDELYENYDDIKNIDKNDLIIYLKKWSILYEKSDELKDLECSIMHVEDIEHYIKSLNYPQLHAANSIDKNIPKVSIVIPCYNKENYINNMLASIFAQTWSHLELILVNDGSTDGTREIIEKWYNKFVKNNIEVVIIDQENRGLPAAVHEGLKYVTGEYVCQVDADDELDLDYINTMAAFLEKNAEYDWVLTDILYVNDDGTEKYKNYLGWSMPVETAVENFVKVFLLGRSLNTAHESMVRMDYIRKIKLVENYFHEIRRTQEPQWAIPLGVGGGKLKYIKEALYRYKQNDTMMSIRKTYDDYKKYDEQYEAIVSKTIENLVINFKEKKKLFIYAQLGHYERMFNFALRYEQEDEAKRWGARAIAFINAIFTPAPMLSFESINDLKEIFSTLVNYFVSIKHKQFTFSDKKRIIAWGALGNNGKLYLPKLQGTPLQPDELWDAGGDGQAVKLPSIAELTKDDVVLILPSKQGVVKQIREALAESNCHTVPFEDIANLVRKNHLAQFNENKYTLTLMAQKKESQPKVSMVIPCYNKAEWIADMLDSILCQQWENIELILVNDGSTDGTREVIQRYEPKIRLRGYELIIIDQENQGVAAATQNGLMKITGAYVCVVDSDDELNPEYVSTLAGYLCENPSCQWVVSDIEDCRNGNVNYVSWDYGWDVSLIEKDRPIVEKYPYKLLESFILGTCLRNIFSTMARVDYVIECKVLDNFIADVRVSQEPQFYLPLAVGGVPPVHIRRALYKRMVRDESIMSALQTIQGSIDFTRKYDALIKDILEKYITLGVYEQSLLEISHIIHQAGSMSKFPGYDWKGEVCKLTNQLNKIELTTTPIEDEKAVLLGILTLSRLAKWKIVGYKFPILQKKNIRKLIAYAAFGTAAKSVKSSLLTSDLRPDVYWDIDAHDGDSVNGIPVVKPDFNNLTPNDTILMLLKSAPLIKTVTEQLKNAQPNITIWFLKDVQDYLTRFHLGL